MVRAVPWVALALLLAGCAQRADVAAIELGGMPERCTHGERCAWAWWNASVVAKGSFGTGLRWPTPEPTAPFFSQLNEPTAMPWWWGWTANATAKGGGLSMGPSPESGYAYLNGKDAARGGSYFFAHDGESLFRSRWNWSAESGDSASQPAKIWGDFVNVTMSFDVRWGECERRATYWLAEPRAMDGTFPLVGEDVTRCGERLHG